MHIQLLGHTEASVGERPVALGGAKQRAVLAMLGLEANRLVSSDRLVEGLWGEDPPPSAAKMVQNYVWRLRKVLEGAEIVTRGRAYELQIDRELIDALRFERLVSEATRGGSADAARQALALFHGEPLADIASEPFAGAEIRRLEQLRLTASELAIDADLAAGHHQEVLAEIDQLLAEHPLHERAHAQRLLALYRCGRQAEALAAYREARTRLVEEIGIEPGPELQRLHAAILRQDPALAIEAATPALPVELERAAATPMYARERELQHLLQQRSLATLVGAYGMGKTRLAAELARELHRTGVPVFYAACSGPSEAALAAIARAATGRETLLVLDDADRAPQEVLATLPGPPVRTLLTGLQAATLGRLADPLVLEPLDAAAVAAIAARYAPPGAKIPVAELLETSRGVPRRVHEAASDWGRRHATDRVDALAAATAERRTEARALATELAGSVADLQTTLERIETPAAPSAALCPYKGLASFGRDDAEYFFGREGLVAELVAHLVGARLLAVVGPSGSGKSSVLRAGLLPALAGGVLPGSQHWEQAVIRPGAHPMRGLAEPRDMLVVDQFEELFTACTDEGERTEFVDALLAHPRVVVSVRADFYGRCAAFGAFARAVGANHVLVGPMTREELRRAIERPAQRAGLEVEPALTDALLADVGDEPGALPLLSTTLLELWSQRDGRRLTLAAYARSGGVQGAVARLAEEAYLALAPAQQAAARTLFLRLCDEDAGGAVVRRRIALSEQDPEVVAPLTDRRLLTVSEGSVEVAHEALLREWPRLRGWLDEDAEGRRVHRRLREAAAAWEADRHGLYSGARLAAALDWAAEHDGELEGPERAFLDAGRRASGRAQRRLIGGLTGIPTLLLIAVVAGVVALGQRNEARERGTESDVQRLGAQALASDDLDLTVLLARQAVALEDTAQTHGTLLAALLRQPAAVSANRGVAEPTSLALGPEGSLIVGAPGGRLFRLDGARVSPAITLPEQIGVRTDGGGERAVTSADPPGIYDTRTWEQVTDLRGSYWVFDAALAGSSAYAIELAGPAEIILRAYDSTTGEPIRQVTLLRKEIPDQLRPVHADVDVPPQVLAAPGLVVTLLAEELAVRDTETLTARWTQAAPSVTRIALSGHTVLLGHRDGSVSFVDTATQATERVRAHSDRVLQLTFSADGRLAASAGRDQRILVWDVAHRSLRETLTGHSGRITGLVFARGSLYSSALDGRIMRWDVGGTQRLGRPFAVPRPVGDPALSRDGRTLALAHTDGTVTLTDVRTLRSRTLRVGGEPTGVAFTGASQLLVTSERSGVTVDIATGMTGTPNAELASSRGASVADGRIALVRRGAVLVRPVRGGRSRLYRRSGGVVGATLSPDGRTLAVLTASGVELVDTARMRISGFLIGSETAISLPRFLPDNRTIAVGGREGWVRLWSTNSRAVTPPLATHAGPVESLAIGGNLLAAGGVDGTVRLIDLTTRQRLAATLPGGATAVFAGDALLTLAPTGRGIRWDLRPSTWTQRACAIAGRQLTRAEWAAALPGRPFAPACQT